MSTVETSSAWSQNLSALGAALTSHLQDKMHKKMDTDGDGGVSQGEFQAALERVAGELGVDVGDSGGELYASLDADANGSLDVGEVGSLLQSLFSSSGTQAFVQSRGSEAQFAELDTDGDGMISMAEFGITSGAAAEGEALPESTEEGADAMAATEAAETSDARTLAEARQQRMEKLMGAADKNGDGNISGQELSAMVARINTHHAEVANRRYGDAAIAQLGERQNARLNARA